MSKEQAHLQQIHEKEAKRREREEKRRKKRHEQKIAIKIATEVIELAKRLFLIITQPSAYSGGKRMTFGP